MIELKEVSKSIGGTLVLDRVNLSVEQGECIAIVGPSGTGKTTLLRLIAGLEPLDSGSILLRGTEVSRPGWQLPPHAQLAGAPERQRRGHDVLERHPQVEAEEALTHGPAAGDAAKAAQKK